MTKHPDLRLLVNASLSADESAEMQSDARLRDEGLTHNPPPIFHQLFGPHGRRTELVRAYGELDEVCTRLGFGTELTLGEWNMSPHWVLLLLARAARPPPPRPARDWTSATIPEVIADIVTSHHIPLRHELERLGIIIDHLLAVHPDSQVVDLHTEYHYFVDEILVHIDHEESELFPLCMALEDALNGKNIGNSQDITSIIRFAGHGHAENESRLQRIVEQLQVCAASLKDPDVDLIRVGIDALAQDLVLHSAKEGEILFPAAIFSEEVLHARHCRSRTN